MYSSYVSSDGYHFDNKSDWAEYEMDRHYSDWGPGPNASNYGGYKKKKTPQNVMNKILQIITLNSIKLLQKILNIIMVSVKNLILYMKLKKHIYYLMVLLNFGALKV